jgi:osmotically-inducible protein OsmY
MRRPSAPRHRHLLVPGLAALLLATACSPLGMAVGAGATAGIAASEERGIEGTVRDTAIRAEISKLWLDESFEFYKALEMQIYEGRVLLTGRVPTRAMADTAVRLAWQPKGVREVINEIVVADGGLSVLAADALAAAKLRAELTFTRDVQAINYSVRVIDGIVYLIGVAQDEAELDRVIRTARAMSGARGVVSHVLMKDDPRRDAGS